MKMIKVLLVIMFVVSIAGVVQARELEEIGETAWDTITGENLSAPMLISEYVAKTWEREDGPDLRAKLEYTHSIRNLTENNSVQASFGLEF